MKSKINLSRLAGVVALAFVATFVCASTTYAQAPPTTQVLGLEIISEPRIDFDLSGLTAYDPADQSMDIDASALFFLMGFPSQINGTPPQPFGTLTIRAKVNSAGVLVGGVAGDDLTITGDVFTVLGPMSGVLLTGEILEFGYLNATDPMNDKLEFRFDVTGGALATFFQGINDIVVVARIGQSTDPTRPSTFNGLFTEAFSGGAIGEANATPGDTGGGELDDTVAPTLSGDNVVQQAIGPTGAPVLYTVTAIDNVDGDVPVDCSPASGSLFPIGLTTVNCTATDAAGNTSPNFSITVTVNVVPPAITGEGCFILDFREITYFKGALVIMSSNADIRARNGIAGDFNPSVWPYPASTNSRGTLFRVYGFQPAELGREVQNADASFIKYLVKFDSATKGYCVDLGGPARVVICEAQLHEFVLTGKKGNGHKEGSTLLPVQQRNVPGVMLTHNAQIVKVPNRVRWEMYELGLNAPSRGLIDYIGFQLQGNGSSTYREFVDVEVLFPGDSATDRMKHYESGFHTATNTNFETFAGCSYLDSAPGNDAVRLRDVWGPNRSRNLGYSSYLACGTKEPAANQRVRANYEVPFNGIQILPTVNTNTDTLRLFYGAINPIPAREWNRRDHKNDWEEWDRWDH